MRAFSPVPPWIWTNQNFKRLKSTERLIFLYLVTSPHQNSAGVSRIPLSYATSDLQLASTLVGRSLIKIREAGLIDFDSDTEEVLILDWWRFNRPGQNSKWRSAIDRIHADINSPRLRDAALNFYRRGTGLLTEEGNVTPLAARKSLLDRHKG
jgi:hypothetical protein